MRNLTGDCTVTAAGVMEGVMEGVIVGVVATGACMVGAIAALFEQHHEPAECALVVRREARCATSPLDRQSQTAGALLGVAQLADGVQRALLETRALRLDPAVELRGFIDEEAGEQGSAVERQRSREVAVVERFLELGGVAREVRPVGRSSRRRRCVEIGRGWGGDKITHRGRVPPRQLRAAPKHVHPVFSIPSPAVEIDLKVPPPLAGAAHHQSRPRPWRAAAICNKNIDVRWSVIHQNPDLVEHTELRLMAQSRNPNHGGRRSRQCTSRVIAVGGHERVDRGAPVEDWQRSDGEVERVNEKYAAARGEHREPH
jgi:hypothetical protein